jgi:hypothetical protein
MLESRFIAERSPTLRSRVTNGKQLLAKFDGMSTAGLRTRDAIATCICPLPTILAARRA